MAPVPDGPRVYRSAAKVNLLLRVGPPARDGFHPLVTVFATVGVFDVLEARRAQTPGVRLETPGVDLGPHEENLVVRAARALLRDGRRRTGIDFTLRKALPVRAGLGGGSGNAAAALLATRELLAPRTSQGRLLAAARELGADVPFFLHGGYALGRGRGDELSPIASCRRLDVVIVKPPEGIPTATAYRELDAARAGRAAGFPQDAEQKAQLLSAVLADPASSIETVAALLENDFTPVARRLVPGLRDLEELLASLGAKATLLAGSGSAVFGLFADPAAAAAARRQLLDMPGGFEVLAGPCGGPGVRGPGAGDA